jgi:hypothetical protein
MDCDIRASTFYTNRVTDALGNLSRDDSRLLSKRIQEARLLFLEFGE